MCKRGLKQVHKRRRGTCKQHRRPARYRSRRWKELQEEINQEADAACIKKQVCGISQRAQDEKRRRSAKSTQVQCARVGDTQSGRLEHRCTSYEIDFHSSKSIGRQSPTART